MTDLVIGQARYRRDRFFATVMLAKPEEFVIAGAMKKLGYGALDRALFARSVMLAFCQESLTEGMVGDPVMRLKAELDRFAAGSLAVDEAATHVPTPKTKEKNP